MIKKFIDKVVIDLASFECLTKVSDQYTFYQRIDQDKCRYLVIVESESLATPEKYNDEISNYAPEEIKNSPAFDKNTDLVILLDIKTSDSENFKTFEKKIFSIEENPYSFKKYVLYTSQEERDLLSESSFFVNDSTINVNEFTQFFENTDEFNIYKQEPYEASLYGLVAKIHIKIPFLKVSRPSVGEISDINEILRRALIDEQCSIFVQEMLELSEINDLEKAIRDYIDE